MPEMAKSYFRSELQQFEKFTIQQRIAQQEYQAAEMRRDAAYGWYGAYGSGIYGPPGACYGRFC